jgi:hypothetical protein
MITGRVWGGFGGDVEVLAVGVHDDPGGGEHGIARTVTGLHRAVAALEHPQAAGEPVPSARLSQIVPSAEPVRNQIGSPDADDGDEYQATRLHENIRYDAKPERSRTVPGVSEPGRSTAARLPVRT